MKRFLWAWFLLHISAPLYAEAGKPVDHGTAETEAAQPERTPGAKVGLTQYFDSRRYETLTVSSQVDNLPFGLRLWGFTDFHSNQNHPNGRFHFDRYFMEYRALLPLQSGSLSNSDSFGGIAEYNDFNGPGNNLVRFGAYYQHALPLAGPRKVSLQWRVFPFETDGRGWQTSVSYSVPLVDRVSITGFADLNFVGQGAHRWLVEPQLNVRLKGSLFAVLEFRYNGFEQAAAGLRGTGVALGLRFSR